MQLKWRLGWQSFCSILLSLIMVNASFALHAQDNNVCARLAGMWFGSYTFKSKSDCDKANGCTQGLNVMVTTTDNERFHVTATHTRGTAFEFDMACKANKVSFPASLHGAVDISCEETRICVAKFDEEKFSATVMSMKEEGGE